VSLVLLVFLNLFHYLKRKQKYFCNFFKIVCQPYCFCFFRTKTTADNVFDIKPREADETVFLYWYCFENTTIDFLFLQRLRRHCLKWDLVYQRFIFEILYIIV
jgi:hypothetical protein